MADEVKQYFDEYKKCRTFTKEEVKQAEVLSDRIKFFGYDMRQGLEQLEEVVLEEKCSADPIQARKIEDYAQSNKVVRELLKDIQFNHAKVEDACKELKKLPKSSFVTAGLSKLTDLKKDIDKDLKSRDKKDKHRAAIEKLQKQIEADLKIIDDYSKTVKKIPDSYFDADKDYTVAIRSIMTAKPRPSAKTQKFAALVPKMLTKSILQKKVKECQDLDKFLQKEADKVAIAVKESKPKEVIAHWQGGSKGLQKLQGIIKGYLDIKKKFGTEIDKSADKKLIENSIKQFEKIATDAEKLWEDTAAVIAENSK